MKRLLIIISILFSSDCLATFYECDNHSYHLKLQLGGSEHVNHKLFFNGEILVKELYEQLWFIEDVVCIESGFKITTSYAQYNQPEHKETFEITGRNNTEYRIKPQNKVLKANPSAKQDLHETHKHSVP